MNKYSWSHAWCCLHVVVITNSSFVVLLLPLHDGLTSSHKIYQIRMHLIISSPVSSPFSACCFRFLLRQHLSTTAFGKESREKEEYFLFLPCVPTHYTWSLFPSCISLATRNSYLRPYFNSLHFHAWFLFPSHYFLRLLSSPPLSFFYSLPIYIPSQGGGIGQLSNQDF